MVYNGIAYEVKRLAQRGLLVDGSLAGSTHQDAEQAAVPHLG